MGIHYFNFDKTPDQSCDEIVPFQVVYDLQGNLNGFVFQHIAPVEGKLYEVVNKLGIDGIVYDAPDCLYERINDPGLRTMHVYVTDYHINCNGA